MNCQVFEVLLDDLARDVPIDLALRRQGLRHAEACAACRKRLAEGRLLTAALRTLAAADCSHHAPLQLEGVLLNAFEEHMEGTTDPSSWSWRSWRAIAAAAAVLAVGLGVVLHHGRLTGGSTGSPGPAASASTAVPSTEKLQPPGRNASSGRSAERQRSTGRSARSKQLKSRIQQPPTHRVWATDFLPLPYGDNTGPLGDARIVRLRLPKSALASVGLPVSEESATREVTADVLMDEDGVPRAISFVQR